jgi:hypothetical protein
MAKQEDGVARRKRLRQSGKPKLRVERFDRRNQRTWRQWAAKTAFGKSIQWRKTQVDGRARFLELAYVDSQNPLFAWDAYELSRMYRVPPPEWVLRYFDRVWEELQEIPATGDVVGQGCAVALGLAKHKRSGGGAAFGRFEKFNVEVHLAVLVHQIVKKEGLEAGAACQFVAEAWKNLRDGKAGQDVGSQIVAAYARAPGISLAPSASTLARYYNKYRTNPYFRSLTQ